MSDSGTINKVILVGEVTKPPRWHNNNNGYQVLCFTLTTREMFKQSGRPVQQVEEHAIRVHENKLDDELRLGQWLYIEGKIKTSAFVDEQMVKRYKTEIVALKVGFLGRKADYSGQEAMAHSKSD